MQKIAIASGKGGTGKTIVATNLAWYLSRHDHHIAYLDCDVEEPNGHLFFRTKITKCEQVSLPVPIVDHDLCSLCGRCSDICQFGAIVQAGNKVVTLPQLCHGCGGCSMVCEQNAIIEKQRQTGVLYQLDVLEYPEIDLTYGLLNLGEAMPVPVIKAVLSQPQTADCAIIDCPPGTSCAVVESVRDADLVLLVTEPTPFGHHDLTLAVATFRKMGLPMGVIINRSDLGDDRIYRYCREENLPILMEIPHSADIAAHYARGELFLPLQPEFEHLFAGLTGSFMELAA